MQLLRKILSKAGRIAPVARPFQVILGKRGVCDEHGIDDSGSHGRTPSAIRKSFPQAVAAPALLWPMGRIETVADGKA